jgi:hypothetical protein
MGVGDSLTEVDVASQTRHFDTGSLVVMALTLVLFVVALFAKGLTHDLLLEAGVFLVSVKLILVAYKNSVSNQRILTLLQEIRDSIGATDRSDR